MVDGLTPQSEMPQPLPEDGSQGDGKDSFLASKNGRLVVIVGAVVAFLVIAGVAALLVMNFLFSPDDAADDLLVETPSVVTTSTVAIEAVADPVEPDPVSMSELFTFRDIFDPLLKPRPAEEATPTDDVTAGEVDTLYLINIIVEDGITKAVLEYNASRFNLAEGEALAGTPWQVLSIGSNSVVMLFGDSRVTLAIGQGVTTDGSTAAGAVPSDK